MRATLAALLVLAIIPQCAMSSTNRRKSAIELSEKSNGSKVTAAPKSAIVIRLPAQLGTGYSWSVEHQPAALRLDSQAQAEASQQKTVGAADVQIFRFTAVRKGSDTLVLRYKQPWTGGSIAKEFRVTIRVK